MPSESFTVGVVVERRQLSNPWVEAMWLPSAFLPGAPETPPWTKIEETPGVERFYAGPVEISLYSTDTANYRDNLASGEPKIWVTLRETSGLKPVAIANVTADPAEGEAMTEAGDDIVEAVPMPSEIAARVAAFVTLHHVEHDFFKRKRDRANPESLAARPAMRLERGEEAGGDE
jgi:hypothetical protein